MNSYFKLAINIPMCYKHTMRTEVTLPGIVELEKQQSVGFPEINDVYRESLSRLVLFQTNGVTHFYGSPLDLAGGQNVWMSPVEVDTGLEFTYFQLLYVNTTPDDAINNQDLPVSLLEIDEASYKLTSTDHPGYQQLLKQFEGDQKQIFIRHCNSGMAYYPRSISPSNNKAVVDDHIEKIVKAVGIHEPEVKIVLSKFSENEDMPVETKLLQAVHARKYEFEGGQIHSYGLVLEDDPWKYYEIYTPAPIEKMPNDNLLIRVDSGCDIGQIYDDGGCDCREQLHAALVDIQTIGSGAVIHIPAQDGRGFGAAIKMETEGLKRGVAVVTNKKNPKPLDTITAAKKILGAEFDIRTYEGAGRILGMIGVRSVILKTDNRLKAEGIAAGEINVTRRPTNTTGARSSDEHIKAKHQHTQIYFGSEDE